MLNNKDRCFVVSNIYTHTHTPLYVYRFEFSFTFLLIWQANRFLALVLNSIVPHIQHAKAHDQEGNRMQPTKYTWRHLFAFFSSVAVAVAIAVVVKDEWSFLQTCKPVSKLMKNGLFLYYIILPLMCLRRRSRADKRTVCTFI